MAVGERIRVVIADDLKLQREMMKAALGMSRRFQIVGEAATGQELVDIAKREQPHLVLSDLNMPVLDGAQALRILSFAIPTCVFVVFSSEEDIEKLRPVISAGASDFLKKPLQMGRFLEAVEAIYDREAPRKAALHGLAQVRPKGAKVFAVVGAQAGAGGTTIAVNLAAGLATAYWKRVAFVDLDLQTAAASRFLGLSGARNLLDMLQEAERITSDILKNYLSEAHGCSVLAGPPVPLDAARRDPSILSAIVDVLIPDYEVVVLDLEPRLDDANGVLLGRADKIYLVASNDPVALAASARFLSCYKQSANIMEKIQLVLNRNRAAGIPGGQVAGGVGMGIFAEIPHDEVTALAAFQAGKPAVTDPSTPLGKGLKGLLDKVAERHV